MATHRDFLDACLAVASVTVGATHQFIRKAPDRELLDKAIAHISMCEEERISPDVSFIVRMCSEQVINCTLLLVEKAQRLDRLTPEERSAPAAVLWRIECCRYASAEFHLTLATSLGELR